MAYTRILIIVDCYIKSIRDALGDTRQIIGYDDAPRQPKGDL
jgi:hypothetical protein